MGTHRSENELLFRLPIAYTIQDKNINLAQDTETRQFLRVGFSDIFLIEDLKKVELLEKPIFKELFETKNSIPIPLMLEVCRNEKIENLREYIYQLISIKGDSTYKNSETDQKIILYTLFFFNNNNLDKKSFAKNIEMSNRLFEYLISPKGIDNPLCSSNLKAQLKLLKNLRESAILDLLTLKKEKENTFWDSRVNYGVNSEQNMKNIEWMKNFLDFSEKKENKIAFSKSVGDKKFKKSFLDSLLSQYNTKRESPVHLTVKEKQLQINNYDIHQSKEIIDKPNQTKRIDDLD